MARVKKPVHNITEAKNFKHTRLRMLHYKHTTLVINSK